MTFDIRKSQSGQEIVERVDIHADACRYSTPEMLAARDVRLSASTVIPASGTGTVLTITIGSAANFNAASFLRLPSGEIVGVSVDSASQLTITSRAQYGTSSSAQSGDLSCSLIHQGEADNTCKGYPGSCSSPDSWDGESVHILTFTHAPLESGAKYHHGLNLDSLKSVGPKIDPGESIGSRAKFTCSIDDEADELDLLNPYRDRISPKGSRFGKLLARHPFFSLRKLVHYRGLRNPGVFSAPDYIASTYLIDSVKLSGGSLKISALDPLILTEEKKAKFPRPSEGELAAAITGTPSTFTFTGVGDYYYGANGTTFYVAIDSEVIRCTATAPGELTVVERGYKTTVKDHSAGATIQLCGVISGHVIDSIVSLLENYTDTPASFVGDYSAVKALIPSVTTSETVHPKPASVQSYINDLIKAGDLIFYFDVETSKIVINYIPELSIEPVNLDDDNNFKAERIDVNQNEANQYTRFNYLWAPYDITKNTTEFYEFSHFVINGKLEGGRYMGAVNEKKEGKTSVLTNSSGDTILGAAYVARVISRNSESPKLLTVEVDAEDIGDTQGGTIAPGSIVNVTTREYQDLNGEQIPELYQILQINSRNLSRGYTISARRYVSAAPSNIDFAIPGGAYINYDLSDFFAPSAGHYTVYIDQDAVFGSYDTATPAFTTGAQAAGVTMTIIHRGQWLGMGGAGGAAGNANSDSQLVFSSGSVRGYAASGSNGGAGGVCFEATIDCSIDCGSGVIWAGAGGENGGTALYYQSTVFEGGEPVTTITSYTIDPGGDGGVGFGSSSGGVRGSVTSIPGGSETYYGSPGVEGSQSSGSSTWGEDGDAYTYTGQGANLLTPSQPGIAGEAIKSNGNTVTIIAGDNTINIRGRRT